MSSSAIASPDRDRRLRRDEFAGGAPPYPLRFVIPPGVAVKYLVRLAPPGLTDHESATCAVPPGSPVALKSVTSEPLVNLYGSFTRSTDTR